MEGYSTNLCHGAASCCGQEGVLLKKYEQPAGGKR